MLAAGMLALGGALARAEEIPAPEAAADDASQGDGARASAAAHEGVRRLTLDAWLEIARRANLEILSTERSLSKSDLDVSSARADFLPTLSFSGSSDRKIDESSKRLSLSQSLPWGTEIDASVHDSDSDGTDATRSVTISQPLLGGGWAAESLADLRGAHLARDAQRARYQRLMANIVYRVKSQYYEIQRQLATVEVSKAAVKRAVDLFEVAKFKHQLGMETVLYRANAEIQLLNREVGLVSAQADLEDSLDDLKELLNLPLEDEIQVIPVTLEFDKEIVVDRGKGTVSIVDVVRPLERPRGLRRAQPSGSRRAVAGEAKRTRLIFAPARREYAATIQRALVQRPDLLAAALDLDSKDIEVRRRRVQRLWTLDVSATHSTRGTGSAFNESFISEDGEWELGLTATWPLGRVARRAAYGRALLDREIEETALEQKTIAVRKEIRRKLRGLEKTEKNILAFARKVEAAKQVLEAARIRQERGQASYDDVTKSETELLSAQTSFINTLLDYKKKLAELELAEGVEAFAESPKSAAAPESEEADPAEE